MRDGWRGDTIGVPSRVSILDEAYRLGSREKSHKRMQARAQGKDLGTEPLKSVSELDEVRISTSQFGI